MNASSHSFGRWWWHSSWWRWGCETSERPERGLVAVQCVDVAVTSSRLYRLVGWEKEEKIDPRCSAWPGRPLSLSKIRRERERERDTCIGRSSSSSSNNICGWISLLIGTHLDASAAASAISDCLLLSGPGPQWNGRRGSTLYGNLFFFFFLHHHHHQVLVSWYRLVCDSLVFYSR